MSVPAEPSLAQTIRTEIARTGPIPFRRFMELALYDERGGYYRRRWTQPGNESPASSAEAALRGCSQALYAPQADPFGVSGDYFTNSQLQPVFGRLIAQQIARWREEMGSPADFSVVELGPGRGETTQVLRERLPDVRVSGVDYGGPELGETGCAGIVFSNEFFDALPVHSVEKKGGRIVEHYVEPDGDGFRFVDGPVSDSRTAAYLDRYAPGLADGQRIEVNLAALEQLERVAAKLNHGYVLTIDYGYTADQIAGGRRFSQGSLMSYIKHQASEDVLADAGGRDITAHVNFTALEKRGEELGLVSQGLKTQTQFLMEVGEPDQFAGALEAGSEQESFRLRMQLKTLLFGLGETFQVMVQRKLEK
jgi:SAM-dependent MidA family methyltransferase